MNPTVYTPIEWNTTTTPISADNLNHMDDGIKQNHDDIAELNEEFISHKEDYVEFKKKLDSVRHQFTPTLYGSTTRGAFEYDRQIGYYWINGCEKILYFYFKITSVNTQASGNIYIGGIPQELIPNSAISLWSYGSRPSEQAIPVKSTVRTGYTDGENAALLLGESDASKLVAGSTFTLTVTIIR